MVSILNDIKGFLKVGAVAIDNNVFKLHYKVSVVILVGFSVIVNSSQYFGDPIDCTSNAEIAPIVDRYCWFNSYNMVSETGAVLTEVRKYVQDEKDDIPLKDYKKVYQTYYQWIGIVLLLQAGCFYFPRYLWRYVWEEGRVKELVTGLTSHVQAEDERQIKQRNVVMYMNSNQGHHQFYVGKFFFCEFLNFFNVIGQIFLTDWFLGYSFRNYGIEWLTFDQSDEKLREIYRPMTRYFPKLAHCDVHYGSVGFKTNVHTSLCVLPIHVINEKIYLFLWFYFIALIVITGVFLVFRLVTVFSPQLRLYLLKQRAMVTNSTLLERIAYTYELGDWFIIYQIGRNMDQFAFGKLLENLDDSYVKNNRSYSQISKLPL